MAILAYPIGFILSPSPHGGDWMCILMCIHRPILCSGHIYIHQDCMAYYSDGYSAMG